MLFLAVSPLCKLRESVGVEPFEIARDFLDHPNCRWIALKESPSIKRRKIRTRQAAWITALSRLKLRGLSLFKVGQRICRHFAGLAVLASFLAPAATSPAFRRFSVSHGPLFLDEICSFAWHR